MSEQPSSKPLKWKTLLAAFVEGRKLTRFDAERLGDHALNTSVSNLEARGVRIHREQVVVQGRFGVIHCKRYELDPGSIETARQLLGAAT